MNADRRRASFDATFRVGSAAPPVEAGSLGVTVFLIRIDKRLFPLKQIPYWRAMLLVAFATLTPFSNVWAQGHLTGRIIDADTGEPLIGANVVVVGTTLGAAADADGRFGIRNLTAGTHTLEATMLSFETQQQDVVVVDGQVVEVTFRLSESAVSLREVVVTPGRFTVMQARPTVNQTLSREEIQSLPQFGEDVYRAVARLPGLSSNDYSAAFNIRGGTNNEVLVQLDGLELYEPFHLKDIGGGALSILDVEAIGGIDMMTGAFPVEYGDRMSGVFSIDSHTPTPGRSRTSLGLSFTNVRFLTEGRFDDNKGEWLVLARRGYLDIILGLLDDGSGFSPTYYDVFGKTKYRLNNKHTLGFNVLQAGDDLTFDEDDGFIAETRYTSSYAWFNLASIWSSRLLSETVLSVGRLSWERDGTDILTRGFSDPEFQVADDREFTYVGLKQDWTYDLSSNHLLKVGYDVKQVGASYDYENVFATRAFIEDGELFVFYDSTQVNLDPDGTELGAYIGHRMRVTKPLTVEWGLRYDAITWTDDNLVSPRVNVAYAVGPRSVVRLGWGHFYQAQGIHEVAVQDGEQRFYGAERAEHRVVGIEHVFEGGTNVRLEAYQKNLSDLRPRYTNLIPDNTEFFPEVIQDRVRLLPSSGDANGVELLVRHQTGGKFDWTGSYSYAVAEDQVNGVAVPRTFDQTHTVYLDMGYRPSQQWRVHVSWQYHTGWPYTEETFSRVDLPDGGFFIDGNFGPVNAERFPAFHRMDVRISRYWDLSSSRLSAFLEVSNLYNRKNPRAYYYNLNVRSNGQFDVFRGQDDWLTILPSIGISWDLYR